MSYCAIHLRAQEHARSMLSFSAVLFVSLLTVGCSGESDSAAGDVQLHEVKAVANQYVELRLTGVAESPEPPGYKPPSVWMPMDDIAPEGSEVEAGDQLLSLSIKLAEIWTERRQLDIDLTHTQLKLKQFQTARDIADLEWQRTEFDKQHEVLDARIAATRKKDQAELEIARLKLARAQQTLAEAERRVDRLRSLAVKGVANPRELRLAEADFERARQQVRVPEVELETLETTTGVITRRILQADRDALALELGNEEHVEGVFRQIATLRHKQELNALVVSKKLRREQRKQSQDRQTMADNALRAEIAGVVRHRDDGLTPGQRIWSMSTVMFILRDEDMGFTFDVPIRWRNLIEVAGASDPEAGQVYVDVPQLQIERLPARVRSISALPHKTPSGRAYRCHVAISEPLAGLREGMQVDCVLLVPVPTKVVEIPSWAVADPGDPSVIMADGARRAVEGRLIGHRFVVYEGLEAGEQIRARADADRQPVVRLGGMVRPRQNRDLWVPWAVEIEEMVPDGTYVEKGDFIAEVIPIREHRYMREREDGEEVLEQAEAGLAVARIEAEAELAKAYVAWRKATLAVDKARLRHLLARYGSYEAEQIGGDVQMAMANIDVTAKTRELTDIEDPSIRSAVSGHQIRDHRLSVEHARLAVRKTELGAAYAERQRDWLSVWQAMEDVDVAQDEADALRADYSLARENYHLTLARAHDQYQRSMDHGRRIIRRIDERTVHAPFSGRVFYHFDDWPWRGREYRPLKTGRRLRTHHPFFMPKGIDREVRIEVPVRFYGRFAMDEEVPVHVPVLGLEAVKGTIRAISHHFHISELARDEYFVRGVVGAPPMVFTITVALALTDDQARAARPGVTAWMEIES